MQDEYWMEKALELASQAEQDGEIPVGAIIVQDNKIIGVGYNSPISRCDPTAHAEIQAIRAACVTVGNYRLPGARLYVTLEPCSMCAGAIVHARLAEVIFAAYEPKSGVAHSQANFFQQPFLNHKVTVKGGVLADIAAEKMSRFFQYRRQQKKKIKNGPPTAD